MKINYILLIKLFLFVAIQTGMVFDASARKNKKRGTNISVGISKTDGNKQKTNYFNIGLLSNYKYLKGASINIFSDVARHDSKGLQLSGFVNMTGHKSHGAQISGIANITGYNSYGLNLGGLMNIAGGNSYGVQISGLGNIAGKSQNGLTITGLINMSSDNSSGMQMAGLSNISGKDHKGVSIAGLMNVSGENLKGVQLTSLLNIAGKSNCGAQVSALGNICVENKGVQLGVVSNFSAENKGMQIGLSNITAKGSKSLQLGIVNISNDSCNVSRQIGLINIKPHTRTQLIISSGNVNTANIAVRFKNRYIYTQLGTGVITGNLTNKASIAATYRTGLSLPVVKDKFFINGDIGYSHIETLKNRYIPDRLYSIQPRITAEYSISRKLGVFVAGGYSWTRTYKYGMSFSKDALFEVGFVFF